MKIGFAALVVSVSLGSCSSGIAEVIPMDTPPQVPGIVSIVGPIRPQDVHDFEAFASAARTRKPEFDFYGGGAYLVAIDSPGGDVNAAIAIGRIVRRDNAAVVVPKNRTCESSCVFVLAGGVLRTIIGRVGIHRPYDPADRTVDPVQQKQKLDHLAATVNVYLREVNIPADLWDQMLRVSSEAIHYLSPDELRQLGLGGNDPYFEAALNAREAKKLGVSVEEYLRRSAAIEQICGPASSDTHTAGCLSAVMHGSRVAP